MTVPQLKLQAHLIAVVLIVVLLCEVAELYGSN